MLPTLLLKLLALALGGLFSLALGLCPFFTEPSALNLLLALGGGYFLRKAYDLYNDIV